MSIANSHPEPEVRATDSANPKPTCYPCDEALRAEVRALRDAENSPWSNGKIASATRLNSSYVSQYLNEAGNQVQTPGASLEPRLRIWLRDLKLRRRNSVATIPCPIAEQICEAGQLIYRTSGIGIITGPAGIGKSRGADVLVKKLSSFELRNQDSANAGGVFATLIHVYEGKHTARGLAAAIVEDGKAGRPQRGVSDAEHCFKVLKGSTVPIIVDDAHDLTTQAIKFLFRLREATGVPVVLLGTEKLVQKLHQDDQWLRRAGMKWELSVLSDKKLNRKLATPLIEHHLKSILGDTPGEHEALVELCEQIVAHAGIFGSLHEQLFLAALLKKGQPEWNWCDAVKAAHLRLIRDYKLN